MVLRASSTWAAVRLRGRWFPAMPMRSFAAWYACCRFLGFGWEASRSWAIVVPSPVLLGGLRLSAGPRAGVRRVWFGMRGGGVFRFGPANLRRTCRLFETCGVLCVECRPRALTTLDTGGHRARRVLAAWVLAFLVVWTLDRNHWNIPTAQTPRSLATSC